MTFRKYVLWTTSSSVHKHGEIIPRTKLFDCAIDALVKSNKTILVASHNKLLKMIHMSPIVGFR